MNWEFGEVVRLSSGVRLLVLGVASEEFTVHDLAITHDGAEPDLTASEGALVAMSIVTDRPDYPFGFIDAFARNKIVADHD